MLQWGANPPTHHPLLLPELQNKLLLASFTQKKPIQFAEVLNSSEVRSCLSLSLKNLILKHVSSFMVFSFASLEMTTQHFTLRTKPMCLHQTNAAQELKLCSVFSLSHPTRYSLCFQKRICITVNVNMSNVNQSTCCLWEEEPFPVKQVFVSVQRMKLMEGSEWSGYYLNRDTFMR